jgi:hypothetical protein
VTEAENDAATPRPAMDSGPVSTYRARFLPSLAVSYAKFTVGITVWLLAIRLTDSIMHHGEYRHPSTTTEIVLASYLLALLPTIITSVAFSWRVRISAAGIDLMMGPPTRVPHPIRIPWSTVRHATVDSRLLRVCVSDPRRIRVLRTLRQPRRITETSFAISMKRMRADDVDNIRRELNRYLPDEPHQQDRH